MLERLNNIEPQHALGILIVAPILSFGTMDWRLLIPFGLLTIVIAITTLYKLFTSWTWAKGFLSYAIFGGLTVGFFIIWGSIILLLFFVSILLFIGMPD